jgi:hypothetical protein
VSSAENAYIPGQCNIGKSEIRKRETVALFGAILSLLSLLSFYHLHTSRFARFSIYLPLLVFSIGFVQSRKRFCLAFGFMGTFNFGRTRELARVASPEDRARDRKTALSILFQSAGLAALLTAIVIALPL